MKKYSLILIVLMVFITACSKATIYNDGSFEATTEGKYGPITVKVELANDKFKAVTIVSHTETPGISDPAITDIPLAIVKNQSIENVDAITGATITSDAILEAVGLALEKAKK